VPATRPPPAVTIEAHRTFLANQFRDLREQLEARDTKAAARAAVPPTVTEATEELAKRQAVLKEAEARHAELVVRAREATSLKDAKVAEAAREEAALAVGVAHQAVIQVAELPARARAKARAERRRELQAVLLEKIRALDRTYAQLVDAGEDVGDVWDELSKIGSRPDPILSPLMTAESLESWRSCMARDHPAAGIGTRSAEPRAEALVRFKTGTMALGSYYNRGETVGCREADAAFLVASGAAERVTEADVKAADEQAREREHRASEPTLVRFLRSWAVHGSYYNAGEVAGFTGEKLQDVLKARTPEGGRFVEVVEDGPDEAA